MAFNFFRSEAMARTALTTSAGRSGSAATAKPRRVPSDTASVSLGATATMGFRAARIPYILLGTTTPSRPRFTVMTWASAAASTDEHESHTFDRKVARGSDQRVPRAVETNIARVHKNK